MFQYKTVIFDLDGTLFKTDSTFIRALKDVCEEQGTAPLPDEAVKKMIGIPMIQIYRHIFGDGISDSQIEQIRKDVRKRQEELLPRMAVLYDNVELLVDMLKKDGYTLCLCSTGSRQYVEMILNHFHIFDAFSVIKAFTEGVVKSQQIRQILEETTSGSAIVVGDTQTDMDAAEDAGCISIGVSYGYGDLNDETSDFIAHSPMEVYHLINKINALFRTVSMQITQRKREGQPLFVGISGVDTSGKTVFAKQLGKYLARQGLPVETIHMDDFLNPSEVRNQDADPVLSYYNHAFNTGMLVDDIIKPASMQNCVDIEISAMDLGADDYTTRKRIRIDGHTIVLIEGVLLFRKPLDDYFGFRITMQISFDEVIRRASARDAVLFGGAAETAKRYHEKYIPVQKLYMKKDAPLEKSDAVIDNENYFEPSVQYANTICALEEGTEVRLIPVNESHLPLIHKLEEDPVSREMLGITALSGMDAYAGEGNRCYVISDAGDSFFGIVEFIGISWKNRRAEFSIDIVPAYRGRGYGYQALQKALNIGFIELGFHRIWLRVLENNERAIRLYERCGFVYEGTRRDESLRNGWFVNQIQMSILKREWIELNNRPREERIRNTME